MIATPATSSPAYERLCDLLNELFQMNQADLDFGLYRIMNQRRNEIAHFLDHDLLPQVQVALAAHAGTERTELAQEIETVKQNAINAGFAYEESPRYQELLARFNAAPDPTAIENDIYAALTTFFARYYKDGDFISLRRYKPGVYAIPYEGEEVKLYWATADQYYIKTTEQFQDYRFALPDGRHVHFRLVAATTEQNNNKAVQGKERRFVLLPENFVQEMDGELILRFAYLPHPDKQPKLNSEAVTAILNDPVVRPWRDALCTPQAGKASPDRTLLDKRLTAYTTRNSFDYFIHKDLGAFLRRELDFFLKNEVLHLDDLAEAAPAPTAQALAKLRAIRAVGGAIITFLAQIEDFQKRLFLKRKFVVGCDYCLTLDHIPQSLYPAIVANDAQWVEWERLFAIGDIPGGVRRDVPWLQANQGLVLDTHFFDQAFKDELLGSIDGLDERTNGVIVNSENFQALNLLEMRYLEGVKCVYIDPPYNTGSDGFLYKDNYQHASWLTMMELRLANADKILCNDGAIFVSTANYEQPRLQLLMDEIYGSSNRLSTISIAKGTTTGQDAAAFGSSIDYLLAYRATDKFKLGGILLTPKDLERFDREDEHGKYSILQLRKTGNGDRREDRPKLYYPLIAPDGSIVYPIGPTGYESRWRAEKDTVKDWAQQGLIEWVKKDDRYVPYVKYYSEGRSKRPSDLWKGIFSEDDELLDEVEGNKKATIELKSLFGEGVFANPKPTDLIRQVLGIGRCMSTDLVCDFFAGSGTTGHAVVNLNREDGGNRRYILVEMGEYFDTVLKPRILKAIYSPDWKDGKPISRQGVSQIVKVLALESYEDTVNNLIVRRDPARQALFDAEPDAHADYLLGYLLDFDTQGSPSLLNVAALTHPFDYTLTITRGGENVPTTVDLVETFNYLLGLRVARIQAEDGLRTVEGTDPHGDPVLVIWRTIADCDNDALDAFFLARRARADDATFARIYINGDNTLMRHHREGDAWQVVTIEEEFAARMFAPTEA